MSRKMPIPLLCVLLIIGTGGCTQIHYELRNEQIFPGDPNSPRALTWLAHKHGVFTNDIDMIQPAIVSMQEIPTTEEVVAYELDDLGRRGSEMIIRQQTGAPVTQYTWTSVGGANYGSTGFLKAVGTTAAFGVGYGVPAALGGGALYKAEGSRYESNINQKGGSTVQKGGGAEVSQKTSTSTSTVAEGNSADSSSVSGSISGAETNTANNNWADGGDSSSNSSSNSSSSARQRSTNAATGTGGNSSANAEGGSASAEQGQQQESNAGATALAQQEQGNTNVQSQGQNQGQEQGQTQEQELQNDNTLVSQPPMPPAPMNPPMPMPMPPHAD